MGGRADEAALTADHARLEPEAKAAEDKAAVVKDPGSRAGMASSRGKDLQRLGGQREVLSIIDDRLGAQQQLAALYLKWGNQVELQHRIVLHLMMESFAWIALIVMLTLLAG